ncbi:hypothetical protein [Marinobacter oulmenensis]|uniref:C4-type Zn-finger protein n=1 Tax=Marinobacter oulmenensis TaxID=643747 RepID=A0A840U3M6_9GAMM|nr:hypothetical protein [Marinobacter oulmenensis]MBB5320304.1 C4-type Zn-finger protein [Marinobacter oulmenensis]
MKETEITTLEELREHLADKYETEWRNLSADEVLKKQDAILRNYELSSEEYEYAAPLAAIMEDQSAKKTIINTSKARAILIKAKRK